MWSGCGDELRNGCLQFLKYFYDIYLLYFFISVIILKLDYLKMLEVMVEVVVINYRGIGCVRVD